MYKIKSLSKSGDINAGASIIAFLILINSSFKTSYHLNKTSFLIISCNGLTIYPKFGTNLLTKFILPRKDCMAFFELRSPIFTMASILSGSSIIPSLEIIKPKSLPSVIAKFDFFRFREIPYFLHLSQTCLSENKWSCHFFE